MDDIYKKFWVEFFELYRENRCLWDVKCKDYSNKVERTRGYDILLNKFRERFPNATTRSMKKKINNLRTSFRRELRKVADSKDSKTGEVYEPSLWYFDQLLFIAESEIERKEQSNDEEADVDIVLEPVTDTFFKEENEDSSLCLSNTPVSVEEFPMDEENFISQQVFTSQLNNTNIVLTPEDRPRKKLRKRVYNRQTQKSVLKEKKLAFYDVAKKVLSVQENTDDEFNVIGKRFAFQLKKLDDNQRLIAEKLWSDIFFYGAQGKLELDCTINFPSKAVQQP